MIFLYIILAIIIAITHGVHEAMVFLRPNDKMRVDSGFGGNHASPCYHVWFKAYHFIEVVMFVAIIFLTRILPCPISIWLATGILFLIWEVHELAYSYARYKELIPDTENLNLADILEYRIYGMDVFLLHCGRTFVVILTLFIAGLGG